MALAAAWLVFLLAFADSPASLVRAWLPASQQQAALRVVSLNCASSAEASREVVVLDPDVVLFQESPTHDELVALANELYGPGSHIHCGPDASIIARGEISVVEVPRSFRENFVHARVQSDGSSIDVISLRLLPNLVRMDLWSADCWRAYRENRKKRRSQLETIASYLATLPADAPVVLGGDLNAPPGDAVLRLLRPRLADSFRVAGRGWGATILNEWPVLRIDQIWTSRHVCATAVVARKTRFSDHRMVVADFAMPQPPAEE